jgi:hypothetical protein
VPRPRKKQQTVPFTEQERSEAIKEGAIKAGVVTAVDTATLGASKWILGAGSRAVEKATVKTLERFNINASAATKSIETATKEAADAAKASGLSATQTRINVAEAAQKAAKDSGLLDPLVIRAVKGAQEKAYTATNRLYNRLPRNTAPLALETIGEGAGEYLGELAATGEADILDAVIESLAGTAQSVTELGAIASSATADGKTTRATMNAIVNEERRIEQQQEEEGQRRSEEDKQRQSIVSNRVSKAIDVEKTLQAAKGPQFLVALYENSDKSDKTLSLFKEVAGRAGILSEFENNIASDQNKGNEQYIEGGRQIISDSPVFAEEFSKALESYATQQPTQKDAEVKFKSGRVNERQASNQMDEDLMAQEQSGQLFTAPPTDTNTQVSSSPRFGLASVVDTKATPPDSLFDEDIDAQETQTAPTTEERQSIIDNVTQAIERQKASNPNFEVPDEIQVTAAPPMVSRIANALGIKAFGYNAGPKFSRGGFMAEGPNGRYIAISTNERVGNLQLFILGHEIFHELVRRQPDAARKLIQEITAYLESGKTSAKLDDLRAKLATKYDTDMINRGGCSRSDGLPLYPTRLLG